MKTLIVLRHAEHAEGQLTPGGITAFYQFFSNKVLPELKAAKSFALYCAPSERTRFTADIVAQSITGASVKRTIAHQLDEAAADIEATISLLERTDAEVVIVVAHKAETRMLVLDLLEPMLSAKKYSDLVRRIGGLEYCQARVIDMKKKTVRTI